MSSLNDNYCYGAALGCCNNGNGIVQIAIHKPTNKLVAVKKLSLDKNDAEEFALIQQEIVTTRQLQHPNFLPYIDAFVVGYNIAIISPLMSYGSCSYLIKEQFNEGFPEQAIAFILRDVLHGLNYIHNKGFIHRALRASHILISETGQACICGLRYACQVFKNGVWQHNIHSFPKSCISNLKWLSPELLKQDLHGYNSKSDIYSLGMTMCELANGVVPFCEVPQTLMLTEKVRGCKPQIIDKTTFPNDLDFEEIVESNGIPEETIQYAEVMSSRKFSEQFHKITEACLQCDPNHRPTIDELLSLPFFKKYRKDRNSLLYYLKTVVSLNEKFAESFESDSVMVPELQNLDLDSYKWDFENT